jgi:hypothetical protein
VRRPDEVPCALWKPERVVTGARPIDLLAAPLGVQRGLDVHVFDRVTDRPKPKLVADLGASYHVDGLDKVVGWLGRLITRRVPLANWADALVRQPDDVKAVIEVAT